MKLLLQSDDYAITRAVSRGVVYGIKNGLIRNTGMFTNMPWSEECAAWIRPHLDRVCLGIDLNISTGRPLSRPEDIPSLVAPDGRFFTSWESRRLDSGMADLEHTCEEDLFREFEAQLLRFIQLMGQKPGYIHSHAYTSPRILKVQRELAGRYRIPFASDVWKRIAGVDVTEYRIPWYQKPATLENQRDSSLKDYILQNSARLLSQEYCLIVGHMGYVDRELMDLSTYHLYRLNDLDAVTSPEIRQWVEENRVELITYRDLDNIEAN